MATRSLELYLAKLQKRVEACEAKLGIAAASDDGEEDAGPSPQVVEFDEYLAKNLDPFVEKANAVGDVAAKLGGIVARVARENRRVIDLASKCKKPAAPALQALVQETAKIAREAGDLFDRSSPFANHTKAVAEGLSAFTWFVIEPLPMDIINGYLEAQDFYANKVRVEYKKKDTNHVDFVNLYKALIVGLGAFVKANYKTGLVWNGRGKSVEEVAGAGGGESKAAEAPPAPKPAAAGASGAGGKPAGGGLSAVFGELRKIDQSKGRTEGLRHVTKDMKSKGASGAVKAVKKPTAPVKRRGLPTEPTGTASITRIQKRWLIENQGSGAPISIGEDVSRDQEIYISGCVGATILVNAKAKAMTLDQCVNTQVVFESLLSSCEIVNCKKVKVQTKGSCRAFAIDKTDGVTVYLSYESRDAQIATSKSSEMNVSFPSSDADDADWSEQPIPEQFFTRLGADGKLHSEVSDLYG